MKCVMLMFDSLNRHHLPVYGCDWVQAPNFRRLAERTVTFDRSYIASMPCIPARRDLHTGRPGFLHRDWGPLEPFDDSMPQMLGEAGIYSHLVTDHYHYWEDGGANYHCRYSTAEFVRGQEGDPWIGQVADPEVPAGARNRSGVPNSWDRMVRQDRINRRFTGTPETHPQSMTVGRGLEFLERNREQDNWFLQIETFDPHEPFFSLPEFKALYGEHFEKYQGGTFDWPWYGRAEESDEVTEHLRYEYAALVSQCDASVGRVLDAFDRYGLWEDTMLVVWTDHGFLLGEHETFGKLRSPWYQRLAHTPFFLWDPRAGIAGERRSALVQPSLDLGPTILRFFGLEPTERMLGKDLSPVLASDEAVREAAIFGNFGAQVNVTDGRYVYMRADADLDAPVFEYTLMPARMRTRYPIDGLAGRTELAGPFGFTRGCRVMRLGDPSPRVPMTEEQRAKAWHFEECRQHWLWDIENDPKQEHPLRDPTVEVRMKGLMRMAMEAAEAPEEQFRRLGL